MRISVQLCDEYCCNTRTNIVVEFLHRGKHTSHWSAKVQQESNERQSTSALVLQKRRIIIKNNDKIQKQRRELP